MGALALIAGFVLLATTAFRLAAVFRGRSIASLLLAAYVFAYAEVVIVSFALSPAKLVTTTGLLVTLAVVCAVTLLATHGRARLSLRPFLASLRSALADPMLVLLGAFVLAGLAYSVVLTLTTPQNDFDTLFDHLWRAALWRQHHAVGYPDCSCAGYINGYPPHGEIGLLFTMVLGSSDRYVGLVQTFAYLAIIVAVVVIARRIGLTRREALFAGGLIGTLPIVALQASTGQNDLDLAAFLLAGTVFLFEEGRTMPWLAGLATALAVGTKVNASLGIPLLLAVAVLARAANRLARVAAVLVGAAIGCYWYVVDIVETGSWDRSWREHVDHGLATIASRLMLFAIQFVDLAGAVGRNRWLYGIAGAVVFCGILAFSRRRFGVRAGARRGAIAFAVALTPLLLLPFSRFLFRAYIKTWEVLGRRDLAFLDPGRDIVRSASNWSWYGPLGSLLLVGGVVGVVYAVRRRRLRPLAALFSVAPIYWLMAFSVFAFYQLFAGRLFVFPFGLAAATWGVVLRARAVAWGVTAIAAVTLVLALVNDYKRPAGIRLLASQHRVSIWSAPRWRVQGGEVHDTDVIRFVDTQLPKRTTVALLLIPHYNGYVFFGRGLDRHIDLIGPATRDAPGAEWAFVYPGGTTSLCAGSWHEVTTVPPGWRVFRRRPGVPCGAPA